MLKKVLLVMIPIFLISCFLGVQISKLFPSESYWSVLAGLPMFILFGLAYWFFKNKK